MKQIVLKIYGTVQGVFFRAEAQKMALPLGVVGVARNLDDGAVEILAEGEEENLKTLIAWAKHGPELAKVGRADVTWAEASGQFSEFRIE